MALFDTSPLHQFTKTNPFIWLQLILSQKHFYFCIPSLKTPQPVSSYYTVIHLVIKHHFLSNKTEAVFILPTKIQTSKINKKKISVCYQSDIIPDWYISMYVIFKILYDLCDIFLQIKSQNKLDQFVLCQIRICILSNYRPVYRLTDLISRVSTNFGFIE